MRSLAMAFLMLLGFAVPQLASAAAPTGGQSAALSAGVTFGGELRALLDTLHVSLIDAAQAAECKEEGEICKSNADCCSGLACSGDPQATCRPQE
jgi:hypothetical protein